MRWLWMVALFVSFPAFGQGYPSTAPSPNEYLYGGRVPSPNEYLSGQTYGSTPVYRPAPVVAPAPVYVPPPLYDNGRGIDPDRPRVGRQRCQGVFC